MSLALTFLGIPLGYGILLLGNILGILLLYGMIHGLRHLSHDALLHKKVSQTILQWINNTVTWRHIIVIGMPSVPTYPIKIALPLSSMTFVKYFRTLLGSYLFLYAANSLLYFGLLSTVTEAIPRFVGVALLILFALLIYFGKSIWPFGQIQHNEVKQ